MPLNSWFHPKPNFTVVATGVFAFVFAPLAPLIWIKTNAWTKRDVTSGSDEDRKSEKVRILSFSFLQEWPWMILGILWNAAFTLEAICSLFAGFEIIYTLEFDTFEFCFLKFSLKVTLDFSKQLLP